MILVMLTPLWESIQAGYLEYFKAANWNYTKKLEYRRKENQDPLEWKNNSKMDIKGTYVTMMFVSD
jgi:hypothetical protein